MSDKILITYATHRGSAQSVAEFIGKTLEQQGVPVDVLPAKEVKNVNGYSAVILGSGIMAGNWYGDANKFLKKNEQVLTVHPLKKKRHNLISGQIGVGSRRKPE